MRTICAALLAFGLGVFVLGCKKNAQPADTAENTEKGGGAAVAPAPDPVVVKKGNRGTFTIGKSTTFVTGPVDESGHIDYVTVVNERLSKGVTTENNANVAICKTFGRNPSGDVKFPPGFFEKMGTTAPPSEGDYFVSLDAYCANHAPGQADASHEAVQRFGSQPWTADENVVVSGWLRVNNKPLDALCDAVKRTQYYNPVLPTQGAKGLGGLISAPQPGLVPCRGAASAFVCRAMLHLGNNQSDEAWEDLLACHRLGRLTGRGGTLIEGLLGAAIEKIACLAEVAFLTHTKLDAKRTEQCLSDLRGLPPRAEVAVMIEVARFSYLDHVMQLSKRGLPYIEALAALGDFSLAQTESTINRMEWDVALKSVNEWFDSLATVVAANDRAIRIERLNQVRIDLRAYQKKASERILRPSPSELMGYSAVSLQIHLVAKVLDTADRAQQTFDTVVAAFALAWYQRVNGAYPDSLDKLAPQYLTAVPGDLFSGKELIYKPDTNGFLLYSVGVNGRDDGGRSYTDQPAGDDIVVRISQPAKP